MNDKKKVICCAARTSVSHPMTAELEKEITGILGGEFNVVFSDDFEEGLSNKFDLVIFYTNPYEGQSGGRKNLDSKIVKYVVNGGKLLIVHSAIRMGSDPEHYILAQMAACTLNHPAPHGVCEYFATEENPLVTKGIGTFSIEDEPYFVSINRAAEKDSLAHELSQHLHPRGLDDGLRPGQGRVPCAGAQR